MSEQPQDRGDSDVTQDAWRLLEMVNEWVKHAEAKAGVSLAAAGLVGGVLFQLVLDERRTDADLLVQVPATACAALVLAACLSAAVSLWPRLSRRTAPTSLLFFDHIVRLFPNGGREYADRLTNALRDRDAIMAEIAAQISANALVARRKFQWAGVAVINMLLALGALGVTAFVVVVL